MPHLPLTALWGKTTSTPDTYHPALYHMIDAGHACLAFLQTEWGAQVLKVLAPCFAGVAPERLPALIALLVACHDLGKISAFFQSQNEAQRARLLNLSVVFGKADGEDAAHGLMACYWFLKADDLDDLNLDESLRSLIAQVAGAHHGYFEADGLQLKAMRRKARVLEPAEWGQYRLEAFTCLAKLFWGEDIKALQAVQVVSPAVACTVCAGLTVKSDWLASSQYRFPPSNGVGIEHYPALSLKRAKQAVEGIGLAQTLKSQIAPTFEALFQGKTVRPLQAAVEAVPEAIFAHPTLTILEGPTGEGKTEAAWLLASRIAQHTGSNAQYYALPTTATSNQMYLRQSQFMLDGLQLPAQTRLVHGTARFYEKELKAQIVAQNGNQVWQEVSSWYSDTRRSLLYPFGVGTVDQIELAALLGKFFVLRLLGIVGKTIIIDEVHAYDTYMSAILERVLEWCAALGVSVVLLSATLPSEKRLRLMKAYGVNPTQFSDGYPSLWIGNKEQDYQCHPQTFQAGKKFKLPLIGIPHDAHQAKAMFLLNLVKNGGYAAWRCNTVERAARLYEALQEIAPQDVELHILHASMPMAQREQVETQIIQDCGPAASRDPARKYIVVSTQVLEQSLNIDFDVFVSDLAPIDLLLQSIGREHRFILPRPAALQQPVAYINAPLAKNGVPDMDIDELIYERFLMLKTWELLKASPEFRVPEDYRSFIAAVYDDLTTPTPEQEAALKLYQMHLTAREREAKDRLIPSPDCEDFADVIAVRQRKLLEDDGASGWNIAMTRLGLESLTVIPVDFVDGDHVRLYPFEQVYNLHETDWSAPDFHDILFHSSFRVNNDCLIEHLRQNGSLAKAILDQQPGLKHFHLLDLSQRRVAVMGLKGLIYYRLDEVMGFVKEA